MLAGKPVLIRGGSRWAASSLWANSTAFLEKYGNRRVFTGRTNDKECSLGSFLRYMSKPATLASSWPLHVWDDAMRRARHGCHGRHPVEDTDVPEPIRSNTGIIREAIAVNFHAGPACAGLNFHQHDDAWQVVVHGLKYWILREEGQVPMSEGEESPCGTLKIIWPKRGERGGGSGRRRGSSSARNEGAILSGFLLPSAISRLICGRRWPSTTR